MGKDILARAARRPLAILFLLCFVAWLPGFFTLPPLDRDESRFAQASKQMIESGNYVDIRFGDTPRYNKPAGIYWMQAVAAAVFGEGARNDIWPYRLPSLIGAFAAVALTYWAARSFTTKETAFAGAALLAVTVLLASEAKIAKTDAVLLATIVATQGVLMRAYLSARSGMAAPSPALALAGWGALAIGLLVKGPVILLVAGATVIVVSLWDRQWRWFGHVRPLAGIPVVLAIALPWFIAIGVESHWTFFSTSLEKDFAGKLMGGEETHGGPPGYHLALAAFTFWPATLLLVPGIVASVRRRAEPAVRFLLVWAAVVWLAFEIAPTKLPHYILPALPALALLSALWLMREPGPNARSERIAWFASIAVFLIVGLFYAWLVAFAPNHFGYGSTVWLHAAAAVGVIGVIGALVLALRHARVEAMLLATVAALVLYTSAGLGTVPRLQQLWLSPRLYEAALRHAQPGDPPVTISGYSEPSLIFLLGTKTHIARWREAEPVTKGIALIERKQQPKFLDRVHANGTSAEALEDVDGIDYSRGRAAHVTIYRVTPGAQP